MAVKHHPIQLIDAMNGYHRATYQTFDHLDQVTAPYSLCFSADGSKIIAGFENNIQFFDTHIPGHTATRISTKETKKSSDGQSGNLLK